MMMMTIIIVIITIVPVTDLSDMCLYSHIKRKICSKKRAAVGIRISHGGCRLDSHCHTNNVVSYLPKLLKTCYSKPQQKYVTLKSVVSCVLKDNETHEYHTQ